MSLREYMAAELQREQARERTAAAPRATRGGRDNSPRRERPDVHEYLRSAVRGVDGNEGGPLTLLTGRDPSVFGVSDQYLTLDSFMKQPASNLAAGEFRWSVMVQGVTGDDAIGVTGTLENVIEAQINGFDWPRVPDVEYLQAVSGFTLFSNNPAAPNPPRLVANVPPAAAGAAAPGQYPPALLAYSQTTTQDWIHNPLSQTPYGRVTVQIREAGAQSFSDRIGRHHFDMELVWAGANGGRPDGVRATPNAGVGGAGDRYVFTDPLRSLQEISLVFRNPDTAIRFSPDVYYSALARAGTVAVAGAAVPLEINLAAANNGEPAHGLAAGDRVFITGFASTSTSLNSYVNRADGHVVNAAAAVAPGETIPGGVVYLDPTPDLNGLAVAGATLSRCNVYIARRRMRIPLRLRRILPRTTNYIQPS